jgi:hypothetical protein
MASNQQINQSINKSKELTNISVLFPLKEEEKNIMTL